MQIYAIIDRCQKSSKYIICVHALLQRIYISPLRLCDCIHLAALVMSNTCLAGAYIVLRNILFWSIYREPQRQAYSSIIFTATCKNDNYGVAQNYQLLQKRKDYRGNNHQFACIVMVARSTQHHHHLSTVDPCCFTLLHRCLVMLQ